MTNQARYCRAVATIGRDGSDISPGLPSYTDPPVVEVVLGIEFETVANLGAIQLGRLAERWKDRYPIALEMQPLAPAPSGLASQFDGLFVNVGAPAIRLWVMTTDESRLVQVQRDRLILNWRRRPADRPYPRYDSLRPLFVEMYEDFQAFLIEGELAIPRPAVVEVSYVNDIATEGMRPTPEILRGVSKYDHHLGAPAARRIVEEFSASGISDCEATLTVTTDSPAGAGGRTLITLTYRATVTHEAGLEDVLTLMDLGHRDVVLGFSETTTEAMHDHWRRTS